MKYIRGVCVLILTLALTACGSFATPQPSSSPAPVAAPTATPGPDPYERQPEATQLPDPSAGILSLSMRPPLTLNPLLNTDATVDTVLKLIYEPLVTLNDTLKPVANLASYVFSSDYTSANLTLRDDAIWSDGTPVTSADVIYTVGVLQNAPDDVIYKQCVANIASCETVSDKTVKLTFIRIYGGQPYMLTFPLIPAHLKNTADTSPVGNGLYLYGGSVSGDRIKLTSSPYTFHKQALIETVEVMLVPDRQTELHAFNQGLVDVITITLYDWISQKSTKAVRYGEHPAR
jgi:peptide/nickel transport system substrate-binding protein